MPEIIKDGENGFLVEPKNPEQIAGRVLLLLENDELGVRISKKKKEEVIKYSWESVVEKLEKVYFKIAR